MGRPRKPTAILKLQGDCSPSRYGYRGAEPEPTGQPRKPMGLSRDASSHWDAIVPELIRTGVAKGVDESAIEDMCRWWGRLQVLNRRREQDYRTLTLAAMCAKQWRDYASRFGLTPSDRARLSVGDSSTADPAAKYVS